MAYNSYATGRSENVSDGGTGINTSEYYDRNLLENAREKFIISNFTAKKSFPKYEGKGVIFSYYEHIPAFPTPLVEAAAQGAGASLAKINVKTNMEVYGEFVPYTDDLDIHGEDGARFKKDVTSNLGGAAGQTQEELIFAAAEASNTAIVYNTSLEQTLKDAELSLRKALATKFTSMITGSTKYSTTTVRPAYVGFVTPDGAMLMEGTPGWKPVEDYGYSDGLLPNEVGSFRGIRMCETTLLGQKSGSTPVEQMILLGEEALAEVGVRGLKKIQSIHKELGSAGTADALNREGAIGSKFRLAAVTLRPDHLCQVEIGAGYAA